MGSLSQITSVGTIQSKKISYKRKTRKSKAEETGGMMEAEVGEMRFEDRVRRSCAKGYRR